MKTTKLLAVLVLAAFCLTAVSGCSALAGILKKGPSEEDAMAYVKANLDMMLLGEYDDSTIEIVGDVYTAEDMRRDLIDGIAQSLEEEGVPADSDFTERYGSAIAEAMQSARYTVTSASKSDDGFTVLVDIEPISVTHCMSDRALAYPLMQETIKLIEASSTEEEALVHYYSAVAELIEMSVADPAYGETITKAVHVFVNSDGILDMDEEDSEALGEAMLAVSDDDWAALDAFWDEADAELASLAALTPEDASLLEGSYTDGGWENEWFGVGIYEADGWVMDPDYMYGEQDAIFSAYDGGTHEELFAAAVDGGEIVDVLSADCSDPRMTIEAYVFAEATDAYDEDSALQTFAEIYEADSPTFSTCTVAGSEHDCIDIERDGYCMRLFILEEDGYFLLVTLQGLYWDDLNAADTFYALGSTPAPSGSGGEFELTDGRLSITVTVPDGETADTVESDYLSCSYEADDELEYTYYSFWLYDTLDEIIEGEVDYYYDYVDSDEDFSELTRNELSIERIDGMEIPYVTFDYMLYEEYPCRDLYILYPIDGQYFLIERDRVVTDRADLPFVEDDIAELIQTVH